MGLFCLLSQNMGVNAFGNMLSIFQMTTKSCTIRFQHIESTISLYQLLFLISLISYVSLLKVFVRISIVLYEKNAKEDTLTSNLYYDTSFVILVKL